MEVRLDTTFAEPRLRLPPGRGAVATLPKISSHTHCPTATGKRPRKRSEGRGPAVGAKRREGLSIWLAAARAGGGQVKLGALHCRAASGQVVLPKGSERARRVPPARGSASHTSWWWVLRDPSVTALIPLSFRRTRARFVVVRRLARVKSNKKAGR